MIDRATRSDVENIVDAIHESVESLSPPPGYALLIGTPTQRIVRERGLMPPSDYIVFDFHWSPYSGTPGKAVRCSVVLDADTLTRNPLRAHRRDLLTNQLTVAGLSMRAELERVA